ncbi:hypothetical protein ASC58_09585 [Phycicoccus sp. Root101]|nr:hypothetical protein ASC58_09585 [Phycicoccus sp. Root101]
MATGAAQDDSWEQPMHVGDDATVRSVTDVLAHIKEPADRVGNLSTYPCLATRIPGVPRTG